MYIVNKFNYLGIVFFHGGSFVEAMKNNVKKAMVAIYDIFKKGHMFNLSIKCQYDLFDKIVKPILLYGCEIWGYCNLDIIERAHLKFCKLLLNVKKSTPNYMIYGELGILPMSIFLKKRIVNFWIGTINGKENKLTHILYKENRSTEGCSKLKRSVDMTSSGKNGLNIRTNASPKWDRTRCPDE